MGCDRNDGDNGSSFLALGFIGTVVPKNAVSAGGVVWSVRLEHFLAIGATQGGELVRIEAWMLDRIPKPDLSSRGEAEGSAFSCSLRTSRTKKIQDLLPGVVVVSDACGKQYQP